MIIQILISIVFYFILIYLSVNLLGFLVRGLFLKPELDRLKSEGSNFIKREVKKYQCIDEWINIIALVLIITYFYLLFHFWNIGVMAVGIILMIVRLPNLLWEIKHGKKIDVKLIPENILITFLTLGAFPALYYFLYYF